MEVLKLASLLYDGTDPDKPRRISIAHMTRLNQSQALKHDYLRDIPRKLATDKTRQAVVCETCGGGHGAVWLHQKITGLPRTAGQRVASTCVHAQIAQKFTYYSMYVWSSHIAEYGSTG